MTDTVAAVVDKDTGEMVNPAGGAATALRSVLLYTLSDTFGLVPEEIAWLGYELDQALRPLDGQTTSVVPLPVRQEMLGGSSSAGLSRLIAFGGQPLVDDPNALRATIDQWADVLMGTIRTCFGLSALVEVQIRARLLEILRDLGVDDPTSPRPSRHLPNDVRFRLSMT